jgi:hypothetical protein
MSRHHRRACPRQAWANWLSALVVGDCLLVAAAIAISAGRGKLRGATPPLPGEAIASTKEDIETLKGRH